MRIQRLLIALTVVNLGLLTFLLAHNQPTAAQDSAPVLRGREIQIIDGQGHVRASIKVQPASTVNGKTYPENVILRMSDQNGRPQVKFGASEDGAYLGLAGASDPTYILLKAEGPDTTLKFTNKDGRALLFKP